MSTSHPKESVVTFKVDQAILDRLRGIPNRSEFIRKAVLAALDNYCPLCGGTGVLSPNQKRHWDEFRKHHALHECENCNELHLVCAEHDCVHDHQDLEEA
jgi:metal-responsive CopG/Arc/MetJ family transcriptional regulator